MFVSSRLFTSKNVQLNFKSVKYKHEWIKPKGYDTGISVYNRVAGKKVPLIVSNKHFVKWYMCGPTVYDVSHIGHASYFIRFDILNRILREFFDINPVIAISITDIDDKIINRANNLNVNFSTLAKKYELEFFDQLTKLNILSPSFILRVSENIPEIIDFVSKIVKKGEAYPVEDGTVYMDKKKFKDKWIFVSPSEDSSPLKNGQQSNIDFALWKGAKEGEPFWESPWGVGRPGWHIECSAMASKVFGSELDIHTGGIDLLFPHHENEEFQSCRYHDCNQWVNYWLHSGHLDVQGEKMSKSLNNYISVSDFLKEYTADNLRMFCFLSSYRNGLHYSSDAMELPVFSCNIISKFLADANSYVKGNWAKGNISESELLQELEETNSSVKESLKDDFNTNKCYLSLMQLVRNTVRKLNEECSASVGRSPAAVAAVSQYIKEIFELFGFQSHTSSSVTQKDSSDHKLEFILDQVVNFRSQVRSESLSCTEKNFKKKLLEACDSLRNQLNSIGVEIKDLGKDTSSWSYSVTEPKDEPVSVKKPAS